MPEVKDPKRSSNETAADASESRDSDATSSETLSDLEETESIKDTSGDDNSYSTPSPDGSFDDEPRGGRDDAGLM